jgi:hypothetical protein
VTKVLIPTCMHLLVCGRLVVVFVIVSMTPRSAASVSFLDSLFLFGCSWLSEKACTCCLEEVSVSGLWATSFGLVVRGAAFRLLVVVGFTYSPHQGKTADIFIP